MVIRHVAHGETLFLQLFSALPVYPETGIKGLCSAAVPEDAAYVVQHTDYTGRRGRRDVG